MEGVEPAHVLVPLLQDADLLDGALAVLVPSEVVPHWMCEQLTLMLFLLEPAFFFFLGRLELLLEELVETFQSMGSYSTPSSLPTNFMPLLTRSALQKSQSDEELLML